MKTNRKSKTNKSIIDTYETIYNVDLVVANRYTTIDQLNKTYCNVNQEDLTDCIIEFLGEKPQQKGSTT